MNKNRLKWLLKLYGCVFAGFFVSGAALAFICAAAQNPWKAGLKRQTADLLQEKGIELLVGDSVPSAFGAAGAVFSLTTPDGAAAGEAVILRAATLYGPAPCVFLRRADGVVEFAGIIHDIMLSKMRNIDAKRINKLKRNAVIAEPESHKSVIYPPGTAVPVSLKKLLFKKSITGASREAFSTVCKKEREGF
ncbi:MAG: hypothetical protein Pg6C_20860 [Treponemataceae bacterium]|nr:MAG: hypothetical protein Pg6C_20860 [Treponemataceae bacterium]